MPIYYYSGGNLVSRSCITDDRDLMFVKDDYPSPEYEVAEVNTCDNCPAFPSPGGLSKEDVISLIN